MKLSGKHTITLPPDVDVWLYEEAKALGISVEELIINAFTNAILESIRLRRDD